MFFKPPWPSFRHPVLRFILAGAALLVVQAATAETPRRPNVILIITDDQGYGDLGCTGNPILKTPHLDQLYRESVRLADFHVDPTCSPTRSALMTGRYSTRVGVWHTVMGRHMPRAEERMMPQAFADSGYATAMFGKWHLGDNYPFRPQDRGFQAVLMHGGGGVGQMPDYWGNDYFDDTYFHNGQPEKFTGYCTDVFFREATWFIEGHRQQPFFVYLATNAPHAPYRVADEWSAPYESALAAGDERITKKERATRKELAAFYGMIGNLDDNVGRLRKRLAELGLAENTLLIFMTDNGTARGATFTDYRGNDGQLVSGFNAGMRGRKGSPYEGGHHVPCLLHWPAGQLATGRDVAGLAAHFDLLPTLIDLCNLRPSQPVHYDGISLRPALSGQGTIPADRLLVTHHQEVPDPEEYRFASVMQGSWRLILRNDLPNQPKPTSELYNLRSDPGQTMDVAAAHAERLASLRAAYERWWNDLAGGFNRPAEIVIGSEHQNPTELTCFEWHNSQRWYQTDVQGGFGGNGYWTLQVAQPGRYQIELHRWPKEVDAPISSSVDAGKALAIDRARLRIGSFDEQKTVAADAHWVTFETSLPAGSTRLQSWFTGPDDQTRGAYYASVRYVGRPNSPVHD